MPENANWYVVHTYSGYENKVASNLQKIVENRSLQDVFQDIRVPTETVTEVKDNVKREVERKIFPSYVLVKMVMNDEAWHIVRNTRGVTGFVGAGSHPEALTEKEVEALGVEKHEVQVDFAVGDSVKIIEGPLEGFIGTVDELELEKMRLRVIVSMFGRETPIELEIDQVVAVG